MVFESVYPRGCIFHTFENRMSNNTQRNRIEVSPDYPDLSYICNSVAIC